MSLHIVFIVFLRGCPVWGAPLGELELHLLWLDRNEKPEAEYDIPHNNAVCSVRARIFRRLDGKRWLVRR